MDRNDLFYDLESIGAENVNTLLGNNEAFLSFLETEGFFTAPASTKYHGAYTCGLYEHSLNVAKRLIWLTEKLGLEWQRPESPWIIGMFHDICKYDQYIKVDDHYEFNKNSVLKGHGSKSVMILSLFLTLTEEEMLCIRYHMGPYEKEEWSEFDAAIRKYENVFHTHAADMLASKVDEE